MTVPERGIVATIDNRAVSRSEVLVWEDRRIDAAARKLGVSAPAQGPIAERRVAWLHAKREMGDDRILEKLSRDIAIADALARAQAGVSRRRRISSIDLLVPCGTARQFADWFNHITFSSDQDAMESACPDHFVLRIVDGKQQVVETNGGSPLTAGFDIDYDDVSSIVTPVDPMFDVRLDGVALGTTGKPIGGVRHQFRDTDAGVHARLTVEFPLPMLPTIVHGHRWHLACEFSNWFEAAFAV
ncbi:hypothetical protein nbrc107696_42110 [Gordonia spumicola]|uniref:Uncharacterized protein n=1 Tax=Gordonia spumicola TaxID=589161 RepID=A0A7I9VEP8_9ACTN|nr:hypothetical protein [Gordonia spumicola]GEE03765.1 hypothetical protein nbrc107696_42110 [Gordonia spumicola]